MHMQRSFDICCALCALACIGWLFCLCKLCIWNYVEHHNIELRFDNAISSWWTKTLTREIPLLISASKCNSHSEIIWNLLCIVCIGLHWLVVLPLQALRLECWKSDYSAEIWQCHVFLLNKGSRRIVFLTLASPEQRDKLIGLESLLSLNYTT